MKAILGKRRHRFAGKTTKAGEPMTKAYPLLRGFHVQPKKADK